MAPYSIELKLLLTDVLHSRNREFWTFFAVLDLNALTFIHEPEA